MELPVQSQQSSAARSTAEVRAMGVAIQANLVQLKVADTRRRGIKLDEHEIKASSPGAVTSFRETLIDRRQLHGYSGGELGLRLREAWGQFCLMRWTLHLSPASSPELSQLADDAEMRCPTELEAKHAEVHAMLWRLRFEQRRRRDDAFVASPQCESDSALAQRIPVKPFGKEIDACRDEELLLSACEHAGMLAVLRWVMDSRCAWGDPDLMAVAERPF